MHLFNRTGKKLAAITTAIDARKSQLENQQEKLNTLERERVLIEEDVQRISEVIDTERREQAQYEREKNRLVTDAAAERTLLAQLRQEIAEAKDAAEVARARKSQLLAEVADAENLVHREHLAAEASAEVARVRAMQLHAEHEAERDNWQAMRGQHEEMKRQLDSAASQCDEARKNRDETKRICMDIKEELRELTLRHQRLDADCAEAEADVTKERATHTELNNELADLDAASREKLTAYKDLEGQHSSQQTMLKRVTDDLAHQQQSLTNQMVDCEHRVERAKAQREQSQLEHDVVRETLGQLLPDYFQLQTDHTARRREMEQSRREHEILSWEYHKVNRDLEMLCKSYDPSYQQAVQSGPKPVEVNS